MDADTIVFLHGLGTTRTGWEPQLEDLSDTWRCVAWDMPGYGSSQPLAEPLSFAALGDSVATLLDQLRVETAHLVGLSFGGMHALHAALRHPGRVSSLTLADTSPAFGADGTTTRDEWIAARLSTIDGGATPADIAPAVLSGIAGPDFGGELLDLGVASMSRISSDGLRAAVHLLPDHDVRADLERITAPTLVVVGELDTETPPAFAQELADGITGATFVEIPKAGHLTPLEAPATFNHTLRSFIAKGAA